MRRERRFPIGFGFIDWPNSRFPTGAPLFKDRRSGVHRSKPRAQRQELDSEPSLPGHNRSGLLALRFLRSLLLALLRVSGLEKPSETIMSGRKIEPPMNADERRERHPRWFASASIGVHRRPSAVNESLAWQRARNASRPGSRLQPTLPELRLTNGSKGGG